MRSETFKYVTLVLGNTRRSSKKKETQFIHTYNEYMAIHRDVLTKRILNIIISCY